MSEYSLSFWLVLLIGLHALICDHKNRLCHRPISILLYEGASYLVYARIKNVALIGHDPIGRGFSLRWILR